MSRSDPERLRDIVECIEAIDRAEVTVARYPGDPDVAKDSARRPSRAAFSRLGRPSRAYRWVCVSAIRTCLGLTWPVCAT